MLKITRDQLNHFQAIAEDQANARMVKWLKLRFPMATSRTSDDELLVFVKSQRLQARDYGIEREDSFAAFLDFVVMYGTDFPQQNWAVDVMTSNLHGPDKVALLQSRIESTGVGLGSHG